MSDLLQFIKETEAAHFRTVHDTGANLNALLVWNLVREHAGLPRLRLSDLRSYCSKCACYHTTPHCH
jgi:hypothetical protein